MKSYDQRVTQPDNWLTALFTTDEHDRQFVKVVHLPKWQSWDEWTNEQYEEWQERYQPKPEKEMEESVAQTTDNIRT